MAKNYFVKDLENVFKFNSSKKKIVSCTTKQLTAPGENYGSLMLALEVTLKEDELVEIINIVAKMPPPNEWLQEMFNIPLTFKKEINFYNKILPLVETMQIEECGELFVDIFPSYYGSRINLCENSECVDSDAVLLLENLKLAGFTNGDRMKGFDFETAKLILKDLAVFHSTFVALKLKKPSIFQSDVLPHLVKTPAFASMPDEVSLAMFQGMVDIVKENTNLSHLCDTILDTLILGSNNYKNRTPREPSEPFATVTHFDFWTNNTMIKVENGKAVKNKIVDFQLIQYGSPAADLLFFLLSSVQKNVLDTRYSELVKYYYNSFVDTLKKFKCEHSTFTFELFEKEIAIEAKQMVFFHAMVMMRPIYSIKDKVKDMEEITEEEFNNQNNLSDQYNGRIIDIVSTFASKNWL